MQARISGAAGDFDIHKIKQVERQLLVYHAPVGGSPVSVQLSRGGCQVADALRPVRETEDRYGILILIDRGGPHDMGRHSAVILQEVGSFIEGEIAARRGDVYAIVDTYGSTHDRRTLDPTDDAVKIREFLGMAPPPSKPGSDVYGNAQHGIDVLKRKPMPLRAAIIISDGRDPQAASASAIEDLRRKSLADEVPISAIVVDRSEEVEAGRQGPLKEAREQLRRLAQETGGKAKEAKVRTLREGLRDALHDFGQGISAIQRTRCTLCGEAAGETTIHLVIGQSAATSARTLLIAASGLPACPGAVAARRQPWWPLVAGGGALLGIALALVLGVRARATRRAEEAESQRQALLARQAHLEGSLAAETAAREAETRERQRLADEAAEREQRQRLAEEEAQRKQRDKVLFVLRVVQGPEGVPGRFDLRAGEHVVGRDAGVAIRLPAQSVSAPHARLIVTPDGRVLVRDLESRNGTFVNGNAIPPAHDRELRAGDELKFSRHVLLRLEPAEPAVESRP
jgi:hypothetical protein